MSARILDGRAVAAAIVASLNAPFGDDIGYGVLRL